MFRKTILPLLVLFSGLSAGSESITWLTPRIVDLGRMKEGTNAEGEIRFVNTGNGDIRILDLRPGCGCTVADITKTVYAPGDTAVVTFVLNTRHLSGVVRKSITINWDDGESRSKVLVIQANVYQELDVQPRYLNVARKAKETADPLIELLILKNNSEKKIHIRNVSVDKNGIEVAPAAFSLEPGEEKGIRVTITNDVAERVTGFIVIETDCESRSKINVPLFIHVEGV